ncbi:MAG: hypothetical protein ABJ370_10855 [Paracoccaceae bacterium]
MIGLFILGGVFGATGASTALLMGASLPKAALIYFGVGTVLPATGIISMSLRSNENKIVPAGASQSFEDTLSQWNADPESNQNTQCLDRSDDEDDDRQDKVA